MGVGRVSHLAVNNVLHRLSQQKLAGDQFDVVRRAQTLRNGFVNFNEVREIGESEPLSQLVYGGSGQWYLMSGRASCSSVDGWIAPSRWT